MPHFRQRKYDKNVCEMNLCDLNILNKPKKSNYLNEVHKQIFL